MSGVSVCNIVAWILCVVVTFLLIKDFIKTEMEDLKEQNKH